jgi:hypothetical protein
LYLLVVVEEDEGAFDTRLAVCVRVVTRVVRVIGRELYRFLWIRIVRDTPF